MKAHVLRPSIPKLFGVLALITALFVSQPAAARQVPDIIEVQKSADPGQVLEPGGWVTFTISIENISPLTVTVEGLEDSVYGPLDEAGGDCSVPQTLLPGGTYACSIGANVSGEPGVHSDTVTAWGTDWHKVTFAYTATAAVTIAAIPPETGRGMPAGVVVGGTAAAGLGLMAAGALVRRRTA